MNYPVLSPTLSDECFVQSVTYFLHCKKFRQFYIKICANYL